MSVIVYAERIGSCRVLGPGNRAVIWVHGCPRNCPGCIAESFRKGEGRECSPEEMAEWILSQNTEGLTLSGGEPFLQAGPLAETLRLVREKRDLGVIVYTGYTLEELQAASEEDPGVRDLLGFTDLLIDGPYVREKDVNQPYVGSSNQRLLLLTGRYAGEMDYYTSAEGRKVEIRLSEERTLLVGVPGKEQREIWGRIYDAEDA